MKNIQEAPRSPQDRPGERIRGTVLRITFQNRENDYRVVKLLPEGSIDRSYIDQRGEVVLVGNLPGIEVGNAVEAEGTWSVHPRHGAQFKADWFKPSLPTGVRGIRAYLGSGAVKGVGEVLAERITEAFGAETFKVLDSDISRLLRIKGITPKKLELIRKAWNTTQADRELISFLGENGVSPSWANRLRKVYGDAALSIVRANPYRLAAEVWGIGFGRADAMARRIGIAADSPERVEAAIRHLLEDQAEEGHTFLPREGLIERAVELLDQDRTLVENVLAQMLTSKRLTAEELAEAETISLNSLHDAETGCARHLKRLLSARRAVPQLDVEAFLIAFQQRTKIELAPAQHSAILTLAREGAMVLTGGPGTGKTTTLRSAIEFFRAAGRSFRLAAPTGRAARRLAESTHAPAETIHRLLGFQAHTGTFNHGPEHPIEADLIVIDEASMLDVTLARDLFSAIRSGCCLMIVGDEDQLPSVGPGNVLADIIASGAIPVVRLTDIFRQAEKSLIVTNAHRVNQGRMPLLKPPEEIEEPDFFFIEKNEPEEILQTIRTLACERIPRKFRLDPIQDIQVLSPMRRGELGVEALNRLLQDALNPAKAAGEFVADEEGSASPRGLRPGDRVMQTVNDYDKEISNGEIGRVSSIDREAGEAIVQFEGRPISYLADESRQLALAYAVTIHKSQGSEYPAVIIPIHNQHYIMLQRNLLYTAMTRGRQLVCLVGSRQALWRAVGNSTRRSRNSALKIYLQKDPALGHDS